MQFLSDELPGGRLAGRACAGCGHSMYHVDQPSLHHPNTTVQPGPGLVALPVHLAHAACEADHDVSKGWSEAGVCLPARGHQSGHTGRGQPRLVQPLTSLQ